MEETFAGVLRRARVGRGLTQEGLAELAGLSAQAIGLLERGVRRFPHPTTIDKLDYALGLTAEERELFVRLASRGAASKVVAADPGWTVAHQSPAANAGFVGRTTQLSRLRELLGSTGSRAGSPAIATIQGMPGVGKTALAIQAAQAASAQYPDGLLYVDLRGFGSGTPLSPLTAIGQLLRSTGVPPEAVPDRLPDAIATFRNHFTDRKVLLLLDNAAGVEIAIDAKDLRREARARLALGELLHEIEEHEDAVPNLEFAHDFYRENDEVLARQAEGSLLAARKLSSA